MQGPRDASKHSELNRGFFKCCCYLLCKERELGNNSRGIRVCFEAGAAFWSSGTLRAAGSGVGFPKAGVFCRLFLTVSVLGCGSTTIYAKNTFRCSTASSLSPGQVACRPRELHRGEEALTAPERDGRGSLWIFSTKTTCK